MGGSTALDGIRVVDLGHGVAGPFAARLLGDLGADVIKVEKPGRGDFARTLPPAGPLFEYLNWNKRGLAVDLAAPGAVEAMAAVVGSADIVIDSFRPGVLDAWGLGYDEMRRWNPRVVLTSVTNFGRTGALAQWAATDLVFYATSGMMSISGKKYPYPPLKHGLRQSLYCAGLSAAYASLAAYLLALDTGEGEHVDLSIREVMCSAMTGPTSFYTFTGGIPGRHPIKEDPLSGDPVDARDGYVALQCNQAAPLSRYARFLDLPQLDVPEYERPDERARDAEALRALFETRLADEDATGFFVRANRAGLMVGLVQGARQLLDNEHLAARDFFRTLPGGPWRYPVELARMSRTPVTVRRPAPAIGAHTGEILRECGIDDARIAAWCADHVVAGVVEAGPAAAARRPAPTGGIGWNRRAHPDPGRLPMAGLRVVDLSSILAGPYLCGLLADLGADVVKIEGPQRSDPTRYAYGAYADNDPGDRPWDRGSAYHMLNRGKRSLVLDLQTARGREILTALLEDADVLVENFTPRVLPKWGFTPEVLEAINPRLIVMSNSGFGASGPWRDFRAQGTTLELTMGFGHVTGYEGGRPSKAGQSYPDFIACWTGLTHLFAALTERARSGRGQRIDQSMLQIGVALIPESVLHYQVTGAELPRIGARDLTSVLSGVFESAEPDAWVAVSVRDRPELARLGRIVPGADAEALAEWVRGRAPDDAVAALQAEGIPAGRVMTIRDLLLDRNLRRRGFYADVDLGPDIGHRPIIGRPFVFTGHEADGPRVHGRAPFFGEHSRSVLGDGLGLDDAAIAELYASGVVTEVPTNPPVAKAADLRTLIDKGPLGSVDENFKATLREGVG